MTCIRFPRILLFLVSFSSLVAAANFAQCLEEFRNNPSAVGGVDSRGHPTSPAAAVGLTYQTCIEWCGSDAESFRWNEFARSFSSWLLPWLALLSQLPFGSSNYVDDFVSVVMSVGSPALAAYSLALTSLNTRSVYRRVKASRFKYKKSVMDALISIQQTPLMLTDDPHLLGFIQYNHRWTEEIWEHLSRGSVWSIKAGIFVGWVVTPLVFTVVSAFVFLDDSSDGSYEGHAIGILWLWLLCLVIGWLWVPTFSSGELKTALNFTNNKALNKASKKFSKTTVGPPRQTLVPKGRKRLVIDPVPEVSEENEKVEVKPIQEDTKRAGEKINQKASPFPNSAHHQSTTSFQLLPESQHGHDHLTFRANPNANQSVVSMARSSQDQLDPDTDRLLIPRKCGPLSRDEHRFSATFNYSRIMRYLVLVDDVLTALDKAAREEYERERPSVMDTATSFAGEKAVFPPGALISMFNATIMALILQCGTTAAATIIMAFTPTVGLGCHSLGYIIYGGTAIVILFLNIISTIFAHITETRIRRTRARRAVVVFTAYTAVALRKISFLLALVNGTGLIVLSCFQFSRFLDNCYCNASVIGRGADSYIVATYEGWISTMRTSRIVATVLAVACMSVYMVFLRVTSASSKRVDYH